MRYLLLAALALFSVTLSAQPVKAGIATGFPPYQFVQDGHPAGLDHDLAEAIAKEAGVTLLWTQGPWDDLTATLRLTADLDILVGMEKSGDRKTLFLLGRTLYTRRNLLFVLEKSSLIRRLEDLSTLPVARDRDAFSDELLADKGLAADIRLVRTETKEAAFAALVDGSVVAAFMPEAVGWTLARQSGVMVRTLDFGDPGTPVGLAFRKGQEALVQKFDKAAERLEKRGDLKILRERWIAPRFSSSR